MNVHWHIFRGIHTQDLVSLAEANKDFRPDGTVHWDKYRLMGETIMSIMKFKHPGYTIDPDLPLLLSIADCPILSEDVSILYEWKSVWCNTLYLGTIQEINTSRAKSQYKLKQQTERALVEVKVNPCYFVIIYLYYTHM